MNNHFYYYNKSDRKSLIVLLVLIVSAFTVIYLAGGDEADTNKTQTGVNKSSTNKNYNYASYTPKKVERFVFDPNTADSTQLLRLGLQPWQVKNIYRYRAAGGIYRKPLDFAKLYGLTVKQYRELEPYIRISSDYLPASTLVKGHENYYNNSQNHTKDSTTYQRPVKIKETEHIVLNTADTTSLVTIPGIGPYYARKIVQYGIRLGGYVSVDQLDEIEDFPTEAKKYLVIYQAKAITDYRRLHGAIKSLNDLRLNKDFTPDVIKRLTPYVEY